MSLTGLAIFAVAYALAVASPGPGVMGGYGMPKGPGGSPSGPGGPTGPDPTGSDSETTRKDDP